jgi:hypothetical protein
MSVLNSAAGHRSVGYRSLPPCRRGHRWRRELARSRGVRRAGHRLSAGAAWRLWCGLGRSRAVRLISLYLAPEYMYEAGRSECECDHRESQQIDHGHLPSDWRGPYPHHCAWGRRIPVTFFTGANKNVFDVAREAESKNWSRPGGESGQSQKLRAMANPAARAACTATHPTRCVRRGSGARARLAVVWSTVEIPG